MAREIRKCPACDGIGQDKIKQESCELCDGTGKMVTYDATDIVPLEYQDIDPDAESDMRDFADRKSDYTVDDDI